MSNPPHYHYVQGPAGPIPPVGPNGPILAGPSTRHLRPQSSYSLPHGSNGPGRWGWSGSHVSSFDRRQLKVPPQPARPAPVRPSQSRYAGTNVSATWEVTNRCCSCMRSYTFMSWCNVRELIGCFIKVQVISSSLAMRVGCRLRTRHSTRIAISLVGICMQPSVK